MQNSYISTRGKAQPVSSRQAVLNGIAEDGGLYVWPELGTSKIDMDRVLEQDYLANAQYILGTLLPDYTEAELAECIQGAYGSSFDTPQITPLKKTGDVYVLELFHGPTCAFKDVALTLLPHLMATALKGTGKKALILTATSGDTGKAAMSGFQDVPGTGIIVFYPHGKVSDIQYRQMATQRGDNVKVYAVEGNFDDAQSQVKQLFLDEELRKAAADENILLTSANSINVGRLVPQVVYYFEAWKQLVKEGVIQKGDKVAFSVPTGNFGDVLAGYYAYRLGLPVEKFYVASNANNVLTDFIKTGVYDRNRPFLTTISPSMDILISSNLERLLYYLSEDTEQVAAWMNDLKNTGCFDIGEKYLKQLQSLFDAAYLDDEQTKQTIKDVYEETGLVLDPHTAIGYAAAKNHQGTPVVSLATASPYKFSQDVLDALGREADDEWDALAKLGTLGQDPIPAALAELQELPVRHKDVLAVDEMKEAVRSSFGELV